MQASSPSNQQPHPDDVHLQDYLNVLYRRRKTFLVVFAAVFLGVAIYTFIAKPVYEGSATLHVKEDDKTGKTGVIGELALLTSSAAAIESEIELLNARTNAEMVVKKHHLDWEVTKKPDELTMRLLEFTSTARDPVYIIKLTGSDSYTVEDDDGKVIGSGRSGVLLQGKDLKLLISDLKGKEGDGFRLELLPFNKTVEDFQKHVKVKEVGKKTNIMKLTYRDTDPVQARDVANSLVNAYLERTVAFKAEEASKTVDFVDEHLKVVRSELDNAEKELQNYKSDSGVIKLDTEAESLIEKLSDTEKQKTDIVLQKQQMEFALASLKTARRKGAPFSPAILHDDAGISALAAKLSDLEMQKRGLLAENTESYPAVMTVRSQIDELQKKILATYETGFRNLQKQEANISRQLARYEGELSKLPMAERDLARLTRLSKVNADIFTFLLQKREEAQIARASTISNIDIVDPAIIPYKPVRPKKVINLILGFLVGGMLGVGLAFFQDYMDDTIKGGEEAKRLLGWPLLGIIPCITTDRGEGGCSDANLISYQNPKSAAAEAFRSLRTGLHYAVVHEQHKVLMVTSSFPGEGKTTVAANLSEILSQTGVSVLLIGCDMRRPALHEIFDFDKVPGLTDVLVGDITPDKAIHQTGMNRLDYLSAGSTPPNPAELLGSGQMARLIDEQRKRYDYIILDAPPVLAVSDTPILVPRCDAVIVLIEAGRAPLKAVMRMREILAAVAAPVVGIVINDKAGRTEGYGYGYGYGEEGSASKEKKNWWKKFSPFEKK